MAEWLPMSYSPNKEDYFGSDLARQSHPKFSIGATYGFNKGSARQSGRLGAFLLEADGNELKKASSTVFIDMLLNNGDFPL
jgi:hypothetical protein